ncbi:WcaF family extracellular polysaccharide biosynthesis acetyltransferase [Thiocapsa bogorovii]|uniref:WcaF family extracellular polysaccharide biosynthesis acetyltransferase n=1 Tax=Thiocapsa bogorovii TaxID=521689 RepID=UPI001E3C413C|nr:WcaF family extracellular polysaccharide biosynthesis acetyltransferase [Thiocapsa bogorovii]UHD15469.1 WcaF family extracellular polysaccharide biosynthesis acetyltransferase [Thiocapsa bogorovii]
MSIKPRLCYLTPGNKLARAAWFLVWITLFRPSPRPLHSWRCFLLRLFGSRIGKKVHVFPSARIWAPWNLEMADRSRLGDFADCYCVDRITIGRGAVVSQYSFLCTGSHDYTDERLPLITAPIEIGPQAWVTADVFVAPGVTIGEGTVVTARSSVFDDLEPWVVASGNPARSIRPRKLRAASSVEAGRC